MGIQDPVLKRTAPESTLIDDLPDVSRNHVMDDDFFAPPPFKGAEALTLLKRQLRDLRPLAERGGHYELGGRPVVRLGLTPAGDAIEAQMARRASATPEWDRSTIRSSADSRKFVDTVKARLSRWSDDD